MAAKLTFEAQMNGLEKVLDYLEKADQKLTDMGSHGGDAFTLMDRKMKEFNQSLEYLSKNQSGVGGVIKSFDELNKKANDTLSKSHSTVVKQFRAEVDDFEKHVKNIRTQIDGVQKDLDSLQRRKGTISQEDYLSAEREHVNKINRLKQEEALGAANLGQARNAAFMASPVNQGVYDFASRFGMQNATTWGAVLSPQGLGIMAGVIGAPVKGMDYAAAVSNSIVHQRTMMGVNEMLAQRAILTQGAAATQGDITNAFLRNMGIGIQARESDTMPGTVMDAASTFRQSRLGRGLLGTAAGVAGAAGLLGLGALLAPVTGGASLALAGTAAPWLMGGAALGGGILGITTATPTTMETERAKRIAGLSEKDREAYGVIIGEAGKNFFEESQLTETQQRMYGIHASHSINAGLLGQGVATLRDMAPMINMMNSMGGRVKNANFAIFDRMFGSTSELSRRALAREAMAFSEGGATNSFMQLAAGAGFGATNAYGARGILTDYASQLTEQRGFGATTAGEAGAFAASITGRLGDNTMLSSVEAAQTGVNIAGTVQGLQENSGSLMGTLSRSALARLGITDPRIQTALIKMGLSNDGTIRKIISISNKDEKTTREILSSVTGIYTNAMKATMSDKTLSQFKSIGVDPGTLGITGGNLRTAENVSRAGLQLNDVMQGSTSGTSPTQLQRDESGNVQGISLTTSFNQERGAAEAQRASEIEKSMQDILQGTGKDVTTAIGDAVSRGFADMSKTIQQSLQSLKGMGTATATMGAPQAAAPVTREKGK